MVDLDAHRARGTSQLRGTIERLHAVIADNQTIAELFPWRATVARKRVRQACGELKSAELELANLLRT